jgi:uncharacterized integral membrane protein
VSAPTGQAPKTAPAKAKSKRPIRREQSRTVAILVLSVLVIVFAVENLRQVKVDWIVGSGRAPLIIVIVISLIVGILLAHLTNRVSRWRK